MRGTPTTIEHRQEQLEAVLARFLPAEHQCKTVHSPPQPVDLDDQELLDRAMQARNGADFGALWDGRWQDRYGSQSEADLALCGLLAFWTGRDPDRIDRMFRASGLMRDKWLRDDYRTRTIDAAIAGCRDTYNHHPAQVVPERESPGEPPEIPGSANPPGGEIPVGGSPVPDVGGNHLQGIGTTTTTPRVFSLVTAEAFAAIEEQSAAALLGPHDAATIGADDVVITYGDGGAGKTTLTLDAAAHLAAGSPWLGMPVAHPLVVAIVENDGPRGPFRRKVRSKLEAFETDGRLLVFDEPWGDVSIAREDDRQALAAALVDSGAAILICGPIVTLGMVGGGTPEEVAAFEAHIKALRALVGRPLVVWLIHHTNVRGDISGAWGRVPDLLMRVTASGNGKTRLFFQKCRWNAQLHQQTVKLAWGDCETFTVEEHEAATEDEIAEAILAAARANPGASWNTIKDRPEA